MPELRYERVQAALLQTDLAAVAPYMLQLMLRNVATSGFTFVAPPNPKDDPGSPPRVSKPGCILASPSYPANLSSVDQYYVYHWVRDAAVAAIEMAHNPVALDRDGVSQQLCDYVAFSKTCQDDAIRNDHFFRAAFRMDGTVRDWSDQKDGPALQKPGLRGSAAPARRGLDGDGEGRRAGQPRPHRRELGRRHPQAEPLGGCRRPLVLRARRPAPLPAGGEERQRPRPHGARRPRCGDHRPHQGPGRPLESGKGCYVSVPDDQRPPESRRSG